MIRIVSNYFLQKINLNNNDIKPNKKNYKITMRQSSHEGNNNVLSNIFNSLVGFRFATFSLLVYNYARNSKS
jgi:hypothetical protein